MRCGCRMCGTYMAHSEGLEMGCVCPDCGWRCKDCLGTDSVLSREALKSLKDDPIALAVLLREEADEAIDD